ncbi:hypothetical protein TREMEDRAFT_66282 [Tremella mesenterica DSM 1558]|uniref:uncharacterized protein n=1 Tax=Tremella mesenterica (strain ATCC 24925 / CBS 8224 / DSM 1558 / NBRC 9311 / NRRL Y-6157 / RJB 2259-6 / UBC 559-6) TaxID=578456 RepID=UPI00032D0861|nr:uncharacterized protein TREMEDRAFT_66282 [Tremella mesenterica DSM 1558]EIW65689.1 hypothetical protein TREMEDRAFT_66282 [Tremella mesenterica DSM 1558]
MTGSQVWKQGDPLTPRPSFEQREKWRAERACLECGGPGHYVKDCPLVAAKVAQGKMNPPEMWKSSRNRETGGNAVAVGEPRQMNAVAGEDVDGGKGLDPKELTVAEPCVYEDGHFIMIPITNARQPKTKINVKGAQMVALWDSGATSSYINPKTVEELGLEVIRYPEEVPVRMFDGSESIGGPITKFVETGIRVSVEDEVRMIRLDVTKLCDADVVIGW